MNYVVRSKLKVGPRKVLRRNLLGASDHTSSSNSNADTKQQHEDEGAVDNEGMTDAADTATHTAAAEAGAAAVGELPRYPAAAFDLPAAAAQAAKEQAQQLQEMLVAQRVPHVQLDKVGHCWHAS
jgi:hypothetical protein